MEKIPLANEFYNHFVCLSVGNSFTTYGRTLYPSYIFICIHLDYINTLLGCIDMFLPAQVSPWALTEEIHPYPKLKSAIKK